MTNQIQIEQVFPGLAAQRTGLDLHQIDVPQRQRAQGAEQSTGNILGGEHQRGFPWMPGRAADRSRFRSSRLQQEKARKILAVVFNAALQDVTAIGLCGEFRGYCGRALGTVFHDRLYAAGCVVIRGSLHPRIACEKIQTLIQRYRMRVDGPDGSKGDTRWGDQIMHHADIGLRRDLERVLEEQIVVIVNRSCQRILQGKNGGIHLAGLQSGEHLVESLVGNRLGLQPQKLPNGLLAEGAKLSLKSYSFGLLRCPCRHHRFPWSPRLPWSPRFPSQCRASAAGVPASASTRSTLFSTISATVLGW